MPALRVLLQIPQVGYNVLDLGKDKKWLEEEKEAEDLRRSGKQKSKHHPAKATIAEKSRRAAACGRAELLANFFGGAVWGVFRENANCGDPPG